MWPISHMFLSTKWRNWPGTTPTGTQNLNSINQSHTIMKMLQTRKCAVVLTWWRTPTAHLITVWPWPFNLRVNICRVTAVHYIIYRLRCWQLRPFSFWSVEVQWSMKKEWGQCFTHCCLVIRKGNGWENTCATYQQWFTSGTNAERKHTEKSALLVKDKSKFICIK